jgi:hypothetical protein
LYLLATITLEVVASAMFKCILEAVFCEAVQHRLRFCLSPQLCQNGGFSVLPSFEETEKSKVGGALQ